MSVDPDGLSRTAKILIDTGEVTSIEEAESVLATYLLQIDVGAGIGDNRVRQALVLTAVNGGARSFVGGVRVRLREDPVLEFGWDAGSRLSQAVVRHGGEVVRDLADDAPTICVGAAESDVRGRPVLRATFDGWTAGVVEGTATPLAEGSSFIPAGVAAGGIAVAEAFQFRRGDPRAGRRRQGISLWRPELDWLAADAVGPDDITIAPGRIWVMGLGHLGQAYLWTWGLLPHADPAVVMTMLQDDDLITKANESTGLLTGPGLVGERKTRAMAGVLEQRGFATAISERRFQAGHGPVGEEPRLALVGVDNPETRAGLSDAGFEVAIDAGLGGGPVQYLDLQMHAFPAGRRSDKVPGWQGRPRARGEELMELPAYATLAQESGDRCGTVEVAGRSVAAAFVGATASALVIAEATRYLLGEHRYSVVDASLRDLSGIQAAEATDAPPAGNPGFTRLA